MIFYYIAYTSLPPLKSSPYRKYTPVSSAPRRFLPRNETPWGLGEEVTEPNTV
jgi:hypothetical protein